MGRQPKKHYDVTLTRRAVELLYWMQNNQNLADVFKPHGFLSSVQGESTRLVASTTATRLTGNKYARWKPVHRGHLLVLTKLGTRISIRELMLDNGMTPQINGKVIE